MTLQIQFIKSSKDSLRGPVFREREKRNTYSDVIGEDRFKKMVQASYEINTPIPPDTPSLTPTEILPFKKDSVNCFNV